ncbi:hypothetical protein [Aquimarina aggregata]|uniref:hypothetical protein n=1 Tax=Aquimarina aggregata TaxID=1642818 RepID=UPI000B116038|nr:hypothetical protein [Aquimarina aggregata]
MKLLTCIYLISFFQLSCEKYQKKNLETQTQEKNRIECTENGCSGTYTGPEFINGQDIAHQFSNKMSGNVGDKLKELYREKNYKKVDFSSIKMTTQGMGSGKVVYYLFIPFTSVNSKCEAYTSFDHVGGWNHAPALNKRKRELEGVTLEGHTLDISKITKTPEGLQEFWIQWKNKKTQSDCK